MVFTKVDENRISMYDILLKIDDKYYEISKDFDKILYRESFDNTKIVLHVSRNDLRSKYMLDQISLASRAPFRTYVFKTLIYDTLPYTYYSHFVDLKE